MRKLLVLVLAAMLSVGLVAPTVATAHVPPPGQYHPTLAQLKAALRGASVGPNSYTHFSKSTITGWKKSGKYTSAITKLTNVSPAVAAASLQSNAVLASWWNPLSWDWGHILGKTWNAIWNKCMKGALIGASARASEAVTLKLVDRGARVFVGANGYLAVGISACVITIVFG